MQSSNERTTSRWLQALMTVLLGALLLAGTGARAATETITHIHGDISGSPLAATSSTGAVVWKESYRPYGERWVNDPGSAQQSQWFHGKEQDTATGLQYFGARYYDPAVGRFLGIDPVDYQDGNLHSFNRYAYGNNNPVSYLDPDGQLPLPVIAAVVFTRMAAWLGARQATALAVTEATAMIATGTAGSGSAVVEATAAKAVSNVAKETNYLYRGVAAGHPALDAAKQGRVVPGNVGGAVSAEAHNLGGQAANSPFTSWTRDPGIAATHAAKNGPGGVTLRVPEGTPPSGASWSWEWSPDVWRESEVLMRGVRNGVEVLP